MRRKTQLFLFLFLLPVLLNAQIYDPTTGQKLDGVTNPISTAVPFLSLSPDARSGGMGDVGVATSVDLNSQHYNAAKYPFMEDQFGFSLTYSPWLINLVPDMSLAYLTGAYKFKDDRSALAFSLLYFSMGSVTFTDAQGNGATTFKPNEFAIDLSYSRKLIDVLSIAVTGRFIYSNLTLGQFVEGIDTKAGLAGAADIGLYYNQNFDLGKHYKGGTLSAGLSITNIGNKMSYVKGVSFDEDAEKNFLPATLRLGVGFNWHIDDYNSVGFYAEAYKLLVPTPPIRGIDSATGEEKIVAGKNDRVNVMKGLFQSFGDAPDGAKEEMREIQWSLAAEYWWRNIVAIRAGYFHESKYKGYRQYFTLGVGLRYRMVGLDFSYLIPTSTISGSNPLKNTLRVGISFNFNKAQQAANKQKKPAERVQ
ncbi:MAG: type IX secretion system outer membrane channel protein PorV [Bacteroidales bacterium]|nr:type IX secretion system outer membrane channel protein PorV [Bacteroidales bacterium]